MTRIGALVALVLMAGLAGCSEEKPAEPETPAASEPATPPAATESAAPEAAPPEPTAPAANTEAPAPAPEASTSDVSQAAIDACLAAVKSQTNEATMSVLSTEFSEANSLVMVGVGAANAPWRCLVSNDGTGAEAYFDGDDGDGVAPPDDMDQPAAASTSDVSQAAIDACTAAVAKETGTDDVAPLGSEFSEANSMVTVGVGPDRAPWKCLVSNDGTVQEVSSMVDEGAL